MNPPIAERFTGVPTHELAAVNDALGTLMFKVSLDETVHVPEVMVCVIIYDPETLNVSVGFCRLLLLKFATDTGTGVLPGLVPFDQR